jgi:hypothetical protein
MNVIEVRRKAIIHLEEGDDIAFRKISYDGTDMKDGLDVYILIDGAVYTNSFSSYEEDYIRRHLRDNPIKFEEVLDSDGRDLSDLKWEKYNPE